jgi:hypothetical protein
MILIIQGQPDAGRPPEDKVMPYAAGGLGWMATGITLIPYGISPSSAILGRERLSSLPPPR